MPEEPNFGCGANLFGDGPGNYSDFDGGGVIDGGGGDGGGDGPDDIDDTSLGGGGGGGAPGGPPGGQAKGPTSPGAGPGTGGGGGGVTPGGTPGGQATGPTTPGAGPGGPAIAPAVGAGGGGATYKCIVVSYSVVGPTQQGDFCKITVTLIRQCLPLGSFEADYRGYLEGLRALGYQGGHFSTAAGCSPGDTCTTITVGMFKHCPGGLDDTSLDGGGGGAAGGAPGAPDPSLLEDGGNFNFGGEVVNLSDPIIASRVLKERPMGIQDPQVVFNTIPLFPTIVTNSLYLQIFKKRIDSNVAYILSNRSRLGNWDSRRSAGVTSTTVYNSLNINTLTILKEIRNYDGTPISKAQIFSIIGTRILDGTISEITSNYLKNLTNTSPRRLPHIIRSNNNKVNELAAETLIDRDKFTLDPSQAKGGMKNILPNWKTLSSDIDKYIEVTIGGKIQKYYIKDDDTFIDRTTLGISDGDYFDVNVGTGSVRLFAKSEKDHAFLIPEATRQKAISLLGGTPGRTLQARASILSGIEFDYSLSAPRQDFYVLSCVLSSIDTQPSLVGSFLLKDTTAQYALMDTSSANGISDTNEYIKYKANHRIFILDDEDLMLDYMVATSSLTLKQTDILSDSPKENKTIPILTRQIPWYIMVYPTNRSDLNVFNSKSKVMSLATSGEVVRELQCRTSIVPNYNEQLTNKFIRKVPNSFDVYGNANPNSRIAKITPTDEVFTTGYSIKTGLLNKGSRNYVSAKNYTPSREKTGFRVVKEIITELNNNYLLGLNGIGKSLTEFDVYSRLTLSKFNLFSRLENFGIIQPVIKGGLIEDVKIIPPIARADKRISYKHTQLVRRRVGAPVDTYPSIKATNASKGLVPPTTTEESTTGPVRG